MRHVLRLIAEGARVARSSPISSVVSVFMGIAVVLLVLATAGQAAAIENKVLAGLDSPGAHVLTVTDTQGKARIDRGSVDRIADLPGVDRVIGLSAAVDARSLDARVGPVGDPVPLHTIYFDQDPLTLTIGAWPSGTVVVGPQAREILGLQHPAGGIRDTQGTEYAVTGQFAADGVFGFLRDRALLRADNKPGTVSTIYIVAKRPSDVATLAVVLPDLLIADNRSFAVESPKALLDARDVVTSSLAESGRQSVLYALAALLVLETITMIGAVSSRRRDFGRRQALGASRTDIMLLVVVQTFVPVTIGVLIGSAAGALMLERMTHSSAPLGFIAGVAWLTILTSGVSAAIPATLAASLDPVRILRVA